jgi:hypothetical protein
VWQEIFGTKIKDVFFMHDYIVQGSPNNPFSGSM